MGALSNFDWTAWLIGLLHAFIGGGATAVVSIAAFSAADPTGDLNLHSFQTIRAMVFVFLTSGAFNLFLYLKQSPLPQTISKVTSTTTVQKVEETTIEPGKDR